MDYKQSFDDLAGRLRLHFGLHCRRRIKHSFLHPKTLSGKITLLTTLTGALLGFFVFFGFFFNVNVSKVSADNVLTSVTVLNTPPQWTVDAQESVESATSTPTNAGNVITWTATGTDSNNDNYWLIICKNNVVPTPNSSAAPTCSGGASNQWAVSGVTASAAVASAATTTKETFPFNAEKNDWYGYICDGNVTLPQCNATVKQGVATAGPSPFFINHPPAFTAIVNTSPQNPGSTISWTATGADTDVIRGGDSIKLYVCVLADFTGTACGAGGTRATSTIASTSAVASFTIVIPTQDKNYSAFVYVIDNHNSNATSTLQGTNSSYNVSNVTPTVSASSITLIDRTGTTSPTLGLLTPQATSGPFQVTLQVTDNNSCLNASSGNEIATILPNVYRSGVGSTSCLVSGDYNSNNCYSQASPLTNFSCTQDVGSCTGATDSTATFTCTFSFWYNADPTDASSQFPSQNWLASVKAIDDNFATSSLAEATTGGKDLLSFLAFSVTQTAIAFGGLQPGQQNDPLSTTTTMNALGNVGLDESLYGDTMCTTWTSADSCDVGGLNAGTKIPVTNQKAATSSVPYASSSTFTLSGSTTPVSVALHVLKTIATNTPQSKNTYWAIAIPIAISLAGNYSGQNTITAVTSAASNW